MHTFPPNTTVKQACFQPLTPLVESSPYRFPGREFSDLNWLHLAIERALDPVPSGRAFLQEQGPRTGYRPGIPKYLASLASARRMECARGVVYEAVRPLALKSTDDSRGR